MPVAAIYHTYVCFAPAHTPFWACSSASHRVIPGHWPWRGFADERVFNAFLLNLKWLAVMRAPIADLEKLWVFFLKKKNQTETKLSLLLWLLNSRFFVAGSFLALWGGRSVALGKKITYFEHLKRVKLVSVTPHFLKALCSLFFCWRQKCRTP